MEHSFAAAFTVTNTCLFYWLQELLRKQWTSVGSTCPGPAVSSCIWGICGNVCSQSVESWQQAK